jgi:hypothetical protein
MKLFTAAAIAIVMSSGVAFAQDTNTTSSTTGADTDPGNYLAGPKTEPFFTDSARKNIRPPAEFKAAWDKLNDADRADIKRVCSQNRDVSFNPFCTNVGSM